MGNRYVVRLFGNGSYAAGNPTSPGDKAWVSTQKEARKFYYRGEAADWIQRRYAAGILMHLDFSIRRLKPRPTASGFIVHWHNNTTYRIGLTSEGVLESGNAKPHIFPTRESAEAHIKARIDKSWAIPGQWIVVPAPSEARG